MSQWAQFLCNLHTKIFSMIVLWNGPMSIELYMCNTILHALVINPLLLHAANIAHMHEWRQNPVLHISLLNGLLLTAMKNSIQKAICFILRSGESNPQMFIQKFLVFNPNFFLLVDNLSTSHYSFLSLKMRPANISWYAFSFYVPEQFYHPVVQIYNTTGWEPLCHLFMNTITYLMSYCCRPVHFLLLYKRYYCLC